ncbi:ABC transporter permease [Cohnella massiliensis]|uniref:ABC transporter permease n=1 Tax=Cohnella massiliensis TaxID=1816691 RepID=UPI0009BC10F6|nr:ABC transporter permease [Cohnella massiliensis]
MKSYAALAGRYLRAQRKRSALTIFGIVLSVALIGALGTMGQSIWSSMVKQTIREYGSYHFSYGEADGGLLEEMKNNALLDRVGALRYGPEMSLGEVYRIQVNEMNEDGFALAPLHLQEGEMPRTTGEIVVEQWLLQHLPGSPGIGGEVELTGPDGEDRRYRITGTLVNSRAGQSGGASFAYTRMDDKKAAEQSGLLLMMAFKPGVDISGSLPEFQAKWENFNTNGRLLTYLGESPDNSTNQSMLIIFGTLIGLVVVSTGAVIYNAFHISVLERIRQFGLLRTLGATPRQIRHIVLREATTLAAIGIPVGLLCGWGALWLVISVMVSNGYQILAIEGFELAWDNRIMGLSVVVGLIAVYVAAWLPARKASRVSPVEAVKGAGSIAQESVRRARLPSPLNGFGVGGKMAAKNIRRNRTKFRITTFSVVVSVTLFIVFHYFAQESFNMTVASNEESRIAFSVYEYGDSGKPGTSPITDEMLENTAALPGVRGVYGTYPSLSFQSWLPSGRLNPEYSELTGIKYEPVSYNGESYLSAPSLLRVYDESRMKEAGRYLVSGTTDPQRLAADNAVVLVQTVQTPVRDGPVSVLDAARLRVGDKLTLAIPAGYGEEGLNRQERVVAEVTVGGILSENPFGSRYNNSGLSVLATEEMHEKLSALVPADIIAFDSAYGSGRTGFDVALEDGADAEPIRLYLESLVRSIPNASYVDVAATQKANRQFTVQMNVFVYGFLAVIGLIGSLNIINTVQTNLLLRRREFGLLQAVGMTGGQLRRMASLEGVWIGLLGGFWGLLLGTALSYFLYVQLDGGIQGITFQFPWAGAAVACVFAFGVGLFAVQGPLRRMAKANLVDELREEA